MKSLLFGILFIGALCGCKQGITDSRDVAGDPFPEGYTLKCFEVGRRLTTDYVYFLFKDGKPVQGASASESEGKYHKSVNSVVLTKEEYDALVRQIKKNED